jgi:hypothetical protein
LQCQWQGSKKAQYYCKHILLHLHKLLVTNRSQKLL